MRETIDLVSCHLQLNMLFHRNGFGAEAKDHLDAAMRLYGAMADRSQFAPTLAIDGGFDERDAADRRRADARRRICAPGALSATHACADEGDRQGSGRAASPGPRRPLSSPARMRQAMPLRFASAAPSASPLRSGPLAHVAIAMRRASWVHALSGGAFAAVASILTFHLGDVEFSYARCTMFLLAWGWPIVLVLHLLWGQDRRRLRVLLVGYVGLLAGVCLIVALGDTPPLKVGGISIAPFFVPVIYWGTAGLPALFLAFVLLRGIRAVGPVLLVFMIFAMCGAAAGVVAVSTMAGMNVVVDILVPLGLFSPWNAVLLAAVAGMVLVVPFGWIAVDLIRRGYEARCFNDTSIVFDSIWLFQTLSLLRPAVSQRRPSRLGHARRVRRLQAHRLARTAAGDRGCDATAAGPIAASARLRLQAEDRTAVRSSVGALALRRPDRTDRRAGPRQPFDRSREASRLRQRPVEATLHHRTRRSRSAASCR